MFPRASAEYEYTLNAFGSRIAFIIGWLIIFSGIIGAATVALGFAGYFNAITRVPLIPSALGLIVILSALLMVGIKQSAWVAIIFTIIESLGLAFIIVLGIPYIGRVNYLEAPHGIDGIFQAAALIFFAFIGFEEIVKLSEETRDPEKVIPRSLMLAIAVSIVLYILVSLSAVSVLGWQRLSSSSAPFGDIAFAALGQSAFFILSVIAIFATTNTVLLMLLAASRITYGMAESGSLPRALARISVSTRAPWAAILAIMVLTMAFVFMGDIELVASVTNFTLFVTFLVINAALIVLRYRSPNIVRPFKVPGALGMIPILPLIGLVFNIFMLSQLPLEVISIGIALTVLGGIFSLRKIKH
jgi:basic amino acid/polyamine antiporter, APA family